MIVYGDRKRTEDPRQIIAELREQSDGLASERDAARQTDLATSLLIATGELAQGLLDEQCGTLGFDEWTPLAEHCAALTMAAARLATGVPSSAAIAEFQSALRFFLHPTLPPQITLKTPEGYAFYALYPELFAMAAEALASTNPQQLTVIGIRSIGTSLAAVVALAANATSLPITIRPHGHPFHRELKLGPALQARMLADRDARFAIVDEGPGLSGSSFMAVVDWFVENGINEQQIDIFPSHANNPGSQASPEQLARWKRLRRYWVEFTEIAPKVLPQLSPTAARPNRAPHTWRDIAAGQWRECLLPDKSQWPAANVQQERRKFLLQNGRESIVAKFAGLGEYGERAFNRAAKLTAAGFVPPVQTLNRGFLVGAWLQEAQPLLEPTAMTPQERTTLLQRVAKYLEFLATEFPATYAGASPLELSNMAKFNLTERLGPDAATELLDWDGNVDALTNVARPVETDSKMQPWEWLRTPEGIWLKADALDHHADHQCIGPQDIAWDVASAIVELELNEEEAANLRDCLARHSAICRSRDAMRFYELCYLAFQIGYCTLSASSVATIQGESTRFAARARFYETFIATRQLAPNHS